MNTHIIQRMFCFIIEYYVFSPDKKTKGFCIYLQVNKREGDQVLQPPRQFLVHQPCQWLSGDAATWRLRPICTSIIDGEARLRQLGRKGTG